MLFAWRRSVAIHALVEVAGRVHREPRPAILSARFQVGFGEGVERRSIQHRLDGPAGVELPDRNQSVSGRVDGARGLTNPLWDRHDRELLEPIDDRLKRAGANPRLVDTDHHQKRIPTHVVHDGGDPRERPSSRRSCVGNEPEAIRPAGAGLAGNHDFPRHRAERFHHPVEHRPAGDLDESLVPAHPSAGTTGEYDADDVDRACSYHDPMISHRVLAALIAVWAAVTWGGRIGLLTGDETLVAKTRIAVSLLVAVVAVAALLTRARWRRAAVVAYAVVAVAVWGSSAVSVLGDPSSSLAFKAVHLVLAVVSLSLAVLAWYVAVRQPEPGPAHRSGARSPTGR